MTINIPSPEKQKAFFAQFKKFLEERDVDLKIFGAAFHKKVHSTNLVSSYAGDVARAAAAKKHEGLLDDFSAYADASPESQARSDEIQNRLYKDDAFLEFDKKIEKAIKRAIRLNAYFKDEEQSIETLRQLFDGEIVLTDIVGKTTPSIHSNGYKSAPISPADAFVRVLMLAISPASGVELFRDFVIINHAAMSLYKDALFPDKQSAVSPPSESVDIVGSHKEESKKPSKIELPLITTGEQISIRDLIGNIAKKENLQPEIQQRIELFLADIEQTEKAVAGGGAGGSLRNILLADENIMKMAELLGLGFGSLPNGDITKTTNKLVRIIREEGRDDLVGFVRSRDHALLFACATLPAGKAARYVADVVAYRENCEANPHSYLTREIKNRLKDAKNEILTALEGRTK